MIEKQIEKLLEYYTEEQAEILRKRAVEVTTFESLNYLSRKDYIPLLTENYSIMLYEGLEKHQQEHYIGGLI